MKWWPLNYRVTWQKAPSLFSPPGLPLPVTYLIETPTAHVFKGRDPATLFLNSLHYTDEVLYQFVQDCRKMPWWNNTVVVIVADHGHPMPAPNEPLENFKIPILWLGGALTHPGREIPEVVSQLDLASSLTAPLGGGRALFPFSKNFFDSTTRSWAYFSFNNGFGLVQQGGAFVFDNVGKQVIARSGGAKDKDIETGKALQQQTSRIIRTGKPGRNK